MEGIEDDLMALELGQIVDLQSPRLHGLLEANDPAPSISHC